MTDNPALMIVNEFVAELSNAGLRHVCISPGSRSTPLTMALARHGGFRIWTLLDERSAGFFALGLAKQSSEPVALVCTSGTATANYLPSVMEAKQANVPLVVLTADRPEELHHTGANQTVDQQKLFGDFVKWFVHMPVPMEGTANMRHARMTAWRLVAHALSTPMGPVHLNWPFREPLIPPLTPPRTGNQQSRHNTGGLRNLYHAANTPSEAALEDLARLLSTAKRGLIVCGPQQSLALAGTLASLAERWNVPVLADGLSQMRGGKHVLSHIVDTHDVILRDKTVWPAIQPDVVLRFGGTPTSKVLGQFLEQCTEARQVVVSEDASWRDPFMTATDVVLGDPTRVAEQITHRLTGGCEDQWMAAWRSVNERIRTVLDRVSQGETLFEGSMFLELAHVLPDGAVLFAGNSMPVRDLESFYPVNHRSVRFQANRGVSGIDGVVSSAVGAAATADGPTVLVIGDVSFYHDMNGLLAAKKHEVPLVVIVVNNDGGGIFSFLPQAAHTDTFEHFRTKHGLHFESAAALYNCAYRRVEDGSQFRDALSEALSAGELFVIEAITNTEDGVRLHRDLFAKTHRQLEGVSWPTT